jgi:hypothetical protein
MNVYILKANVNNYLSLGFAGEGVIALYRRFDGTPAAGEIVLPPVEVTDEALPASDYPGLTSHIPVFSRRAVDALGPLLTPSGELLALDCPGCDREYVALNVTRVADALDEAMAKVKRYRSGRIMRVLEYAFLEERVGEAALFKMPETVLQDVYVTERFVQAAVDADLEGAVFELVWTDGAPVILCPYCMGVIGEETVDCPTCGLDTTRDAPLEMSLAEAAAMARTQCAFCGTRIPTWADPCPYCRRGKRRAGRGGGVAIVTARH